MNQDRARSLRACCSGNAADRSKRAEAINALRMARQIEPDHERLWASWHGDRIFALGHLTAQELLSQGFAAALETYFLEIIEGRRG